MFRHLVLAAAMTGLAGSARLAAADDPAKKPDPMADLLEKLRKPADLAQTGAMDLNAFAEKVEQKTGIPTVVNEDAFQADGGETAMAPMKPPRLKKAPLATLLRQTLAQRQATYLVRKDYIEIVPIAFAVRELRMMPADDDGPARLREPLVSAIFKEKPLNEAVADLAEEYDLTVVVAPQSGDNKIGFVTARLLNVPADKAIELLAIQVDLRVIRKGTAFFLTGKDHANDMFNERMEHEQRKVEIERARFTPPQPPAPVPAPALAPVPAPAPAVAPAPAPAPKM